MLMLQWTTRRCGVTGDKKGCQQKYKWVRMSDRRQKEGRWPSDRWSGIDDVVLVKGDERSQ